MRNKLPWAGAWCGGACTLQYACGLVTTPTKRPSTIWFQPAERRGESGWVPFVGAFLPLQDGAAGGRCSLLRPGSARRSRPHADNPTCPPHNRGSYKHLRCMTTDTRTASTALESFGVYQWGSGMALSVVRWYRNTKCSCQRRGTACFTCAAGVGAWYEHSTLPA